jgi:hypothetical protein
MPLGFKSSELFGVKVTPTTMDDLFTLMDRSVAAKDQVVIASLNLHGIYKLSRTMSSAPCTMTRRPASISMGRRSSGSARRRVWISTPSTGPAGSTGSCP